MAFKLDQIVPWGRSFDECVRMFGLTDSDLGKKILGCGDGPASFHALLDQGGEPSPHVEPVCHCLRQHGLQLAIEPVDYEFQRGGNRMLRIWRAVA